MKGALTVTLLGVAAHLASAWAKQREVYSFHGGSRGSDGEEVEVALFPEAFESERWLVGTPRLMEEDNIFSNHKKRKIRPEKDKESLRVRKPNRKEESGDKSKNVTEGKSKKKGELLPLQNQSCKSTRALSGPQKIHLPINIHAARSLGAYSYVVNFQPRRRTLVATVIVWT